MFFRHYNGNLEFHIDDKYSEHLFKNYVFLHLTEYAVRRDKNLLFEKLSDLHKIVDDLQMVEGKQEIIFNEGVFILSIFPK